MSRSIYYMALGFGALAAWDETRNGGLMACAALLFLASLLQAVRPDERDA